MRNIIIVGRGNGLTRVTYDSTANKANAKDFTGVIDSRVGASTRINALSIVVLTMEQLFAKKEAGELDAEKYPTQIFTLGLVTDMIDNGTFKFWLKSGAKSDGEAIHPDELELWAKFSELYVQMYTDLVFKNVSRLKLPKGNTRYAISNEDRILADYAEKAWDRVKIQVPDLVEEESEAL